MICSGTLSANWRLRDAKGTPGTVIESGIPNPKREVILKAGHLIPLEQPEVFNSSVLTFFKEHGVL